mgnify:CR=1 FL=1
MTDRMPSRAMLLTIIGSLSLLAACELIGRFQLAGLSWPPLSQVVALLLDPAHSQLFIRALGATAQSAAIGYCAGVFAGLCITTIGHILPATANGLSKLAAALNSIPSIALAPIFMVLLSRGAAPAAVASIHVLFIMFVASSSGLKAASLAHQDLFTVFGAGNSVRFRLLEVPSALPGIATGLRLAAPVAIIGAIIGEWFGSPRGVGVLMVNAMQNFQITTLWGAIVLTAAMSLVVYAVLTAIERAVHARYS